MASYEEALKAFTNQIHRKQFLQARIPFDLEDGLLTFDHIGQAIIPEFAIDEDNRKAYEQLFYYFTGQHEFFQGDPRKGILLVGPIGTGKSFAFIVIQQFLRFLTMTGICKNKESSGAFSIVKCTDIKASYTDESNGGNLVLKRYKSSHEVFMFDDIGEEVREKENRLATHFGMRLNVMENILTERVANFVLYRTLTHATSNFPIVSRDGKHRYWEELYGTRLADRAVEMFNTIYLTGPSRRK